MRGELYTEHKNRNMNAQYAKTGSASCTLTCTIVHVWISLAATSNDTWAETDWKGAAGTLAAGQEPHRQEYLGSSHSDRSSMVSRNRERRSREKSSRERSSRSISNRAAGTWVAGTEAAETGSSGTAPAWSEEAGTEVTGIRLAGTGVAWEKVVGIVGAAV
jgi:hypothetical protein